MRECDQQDEICYEYLDLEAEHRALPGEVKAHMFKILYRALSVGQTRATHR